METTRQCDTPSPPLLPHPTTTIPTRRSPATPAGDPPRRQVAAPAPTAPRSQKRPPTLTRSRNRPPKTATSQRASTTATPGEYHTHLCTQHPSNTPRRNTRSPRWPPHPPRHNAGPHCRRVLPPTTTTPPPDRSRPPQQVTRHNARSQPRPPHLPHHTTGPQACHVTTPAPHNHHVERASHTVTQVRATPPSAPDTSANTNRTPGDATGGQQPAPTRATSQRRPQLAPRDTR